MPYVAIDDHRFDKDLMVANDPSIKIATMDGEISDMTAKRDFPKAVEVAIPQLGQATDMLMNVATHKADIAFTEPSFAEDFIKSNPGKLRRAQINPMQVFPTAMAVDIHETALLAALNSSLIELQGQGVIEAIMQKYNADPAIYMRVAKPYTLP